MAKSKEEIIKEMFEKGVLISEEFLKKEENQSSDNLFTGKIEAEEDLLVLNSDYAEVIKQQTSLVDWHELDSLKVGAEKERDEDLYQNELQQLKKSELFLQNNNITKETSSLEVELNIEKKEATTSIITETKSEELIESHMNVIELDDADKKKLAMSKKVEIVFSYTNVPFKYKINDFGNIFRSRYKCLEKLLRNRQELQSTLTINRIFGKKEKEKVSIIGVVEDVGTTRGGHIMLTLEDLTGKIKVLVSKNNKDLFPLAKELVYDEVIGITGNCGDKIIFANNIIWPDIPETNEMRKGNKDEYAIFLSDLHVGSNVFLEEEFNKFLRWIQGDTGNDKQRELANKVKYIIIAGDLVDGIGIYPTHEEELKITDIKKQYEEFVRLIKKVPLDKKIIICPGNHDLVHLAEPQPIFYPEYTQCLYDLPNMMVVSNPAMINIGKTENFSGFNVLMYHGYSFDYYVANVESIRNSGGYHRADLIMKFLLKRRHLAPAFKSTPYFPGHKEDPLLIKTIPDFFVTGHIHYSKVANYKGVTMISGSCWQAKTSFQEKLGHEPEPARVPVVNLKTREVKILKFV
jgi:DNA polymerase II small subunit